jgi:molecular chaperone DnaK (HSP70)
MATPRFSIGIDLGTSNSALAFVPLSEAACSEVLAIAQWDSPSSVIESSTVPSFLYRPEEAIAAQLAAGVSGGGDWVVGRLAQRKAGETPGRVVHSAKSWLCHHAADRSASFLPWGSDALSPGDKISPVFASALVLNHLRAAWDARFGPTDRFDDQQITITVPASFDAVAQRLTLTAARDAGFPDSARLLEEPQAAFYRWLEQLQGADDPWRALGEGDTGPRHVLVVDIGGGTSDFSLFELGRREGGAEPRIQRVAVSDHILLGGDNIDLAIAHRLEPRLRAGEAGLSAGQWDHLVASSRSLKERVLGVDGPDDESFAISVPGRGSGLLAGTLSAQITRAELEALLLDGFFPECPADDRPKRASGAIKEWGLPYAVDGAVTRHLAEFLQGRPRVDAVLWNGGSLTPRRLRERLRDQVGAWQQGAVPQVLENAELDLAVARGAAYFGSLLHRRAGRIEAGAARAVFLEAHSEDGGGRHALVCILPHGAAPGEAFELSDLGLHLRVNRLVRFRIHTSTRHDATRVGDVVDPNDGAFMALPPLETVAQSDRGRPDATIPVALLAHVNELGLLQVSCRSLDPEIARSWPLEFNLRPHEQGVPAQEAPPDASPARGEPNASPASITRAGTRIGAFFSQRTAKREKPSVTRLLQNLEQGLARPKGEWNAFLVRGLWPSLEGCQTGRALSVEHEEAWLILAGFLLRPGFGVAMDEMRIDGLWRIRSEGMRFPGKRIRLQDHILWRRLAGGLSRERQELLLAEESDKLLQSKNVSPELVRMAGSFERLGQDRKAELIAHFVATVVELAAERKHCAPYLAALGHLLNRTPLYAGPESVVPPALVEQTYEALRGFDWKDPEFAEAPILFLRAARAVGDRRIDLPPSVRHQIALHLTKCGIAPARSHRLREVVAVERSERISLYGEAVPPGLLLGTAVP